MKIDQLINFAEAQTPADHYRPAADKILKGDPAQNVRNHYSRTVTP